MSWRSECLLPVPRSAVGENGSRLPDVAMFSQLSDVLSTDVNVLLSAAVQSDEYPNVIMVDDNKAQQFTLNFTDYLRNNFAAIASEDTVPFAGEMKHTQAYLAVEQAQYEDNLFVEYDTPRESGGTSVRVTVPLSEK